MDRLSQIEVNCDELVAALRRHGAELQRLGVTSLSIFGSPARGDHRPDSDLDILIDYDLARNFRSLTSYMLSMSSRN